jgi:IPT/TIG domain
LVSISEVSSLGGIVTITGTNFGNNATVVSAHVNQNACTGLTVSIAHTQLKCEVVSGVGGPHLVVVDVNGQTTSSDIFDYSCE